MKDIEAAGLHFLHLPIRDMDSPMQVMAYEKIAKMSSHIDHVARYLIHFKGGVGVQV